MSAPPPLLTVLRPDDLVVLTFRFQNLELEGEANRRELVRAAEGDCLLIVEVQAQAFAEEAFDTSRTLSPRGTIGARLARPSRLVFQVPPGETPIPFTLEGLLDAATRLPMGIAGRPPKLEEPLAADVKAKVLAEARQARPAVDQTALELPYGLILSPDVPEAEEDPGRFWTWLHPKSPVARSGHVELWHSRLGRRSEPGSVRRRGKPQLRARWPGVNTIDHLDHETGLPKTPEAPDAASDFPTTLRFQDRDDLLLYGNLNLESVPAIQADHLILTPLGSWFEAAWTAENEQPPGNLVAWSHRMTTGREHYVRVVSRGYLFPFGHRAVHVAVSERKLQGDDQGVLAGYTRKKEFIVVREAERQYREHGQRGRSLPFRGMPFTAVRIKTLSTPTVTSKDFVARTTAFWPLVGDQDFSFELVGIDHAGNEVDFRAPLAFFPADVAEGAGLAALLDDDEVFGADPGVRAFRRVRQMAGRCIAFADPGAATGGRAPDSTFETESVEFRAEAVPRESGGSPLRPCLVRASAAVPAVQRITNSPAAVTFTYDDTYKKAPGDLAKGLSDVEHKLDVFANLVAPLPVSLGAGSAGGLVAPTMAMTALSQTFGPLGGEPADLVAGTFNPASFFGAIGGGPKLLGGMDLTKIVTPLVFPSAGFAVISDGAGASATRLPSMTTTTQPDGATVTQFSWRTQENQLAALSVPPLAFTPEPNATLALDATRRVPADGSPATAKVVGRLTRFKLTLASGDTPFVSLPFTSIEFCAESGKKVDVAVDVGTVTFEGPLSFVNTLAAIIPPEGFLDPPALSVTPAGVSVSYGLALPTVGLGYLTLQNLSLSAGFHLPLLDGSTSLTFHFAERHNPFIVTYSALGGGGYFGLELGTDGIRTLEASFEFGGAVALNLGVAAGAASITAGIYYGERDGIHALAGFVRCSGELEVLGILTISAQFYLELRYVGPPTNDPPAKATGTASLTVEVELLFISKSVTVTVQREFSKGSDPTFEDTMPELALWQDYCDAFADDGS